VLFDLSEIIEVVFHCDKTKAFSPLRAQRFTERFSASSAIFI
jgi:hypothetical protein